MVASYSLNRFCYGARYIFPYDLHALTFKFSCFFSYVEILMVEKVSNTFCPSAFNQVSGPPRGSIGFGVFGVFYLFRGIFFMRLVHSVSRAAKVSYKICLEYLHQG